MIAFTIAPRARLDAIDVHIASCWNHRWVQDLAAAGIVWQPRWHEIDIRAPVVYTYSRRLYIYICSTVVCVVYTHIRIHTPPAALFSSLYICDGLQESFQRSTMDDDKAQRTGNTRIATQLWSPWFATDDPRCKMTAEYPKPHRVCVYHDPPFQAR